MRHAQHEDALFTAAQIARFCQVDLKTIHNWAERGEIEHFRTPGRHLRFRAQDTLDFLRRYGYEIPPILLGTRPRLHVLDADAARVTQIKRQLARRFEVIGHDDPIDGLIALGNHAPDAVLIDLDMHAIDGLHCVARVHAHAFTKHVRVIACAHDLARKPSALAAGASAFIDKSELSGLRFVLEALMGRARS